MKLKTKKPTQPKSVQVGRDIKITQDQHARLVTYVKDRLDWASVGRAKRIERFTAIDKEVSGFLVLSEDDAARKRDLEKGIGVKPYQTNLQLTKTQMNDALTYFMSVFFPEEGPYNAMAPKERQAVAKGLAALMNTHSGRFKHFRHFSKFAFDGLKYNEGLMQVDWEKIMGTTVGNSDQAKLLKLETDQVIAEGNKLSYCDPYNTLRDPSVDLLDLAEKGEFFATVEAVSKHSAERMFLNKELYNRPSEEVFKTGAANKMSYYETKPDIVGDNGKGSGTGTNEVDWVAYLSADSGNSKSKMGVLEFVYMYIWLPEKDFGLGTEERYAIWRITLLNGERVVQAEKMTNAHGMLPIGAIRLWDDNFGDQTQSYAEMLLPYQRFASFQMNTHVESSRKALYGLTVYLETMFPDMKEADITGGKVPAKNVQDMDDIRKYIMQLNDAPQTGGTLGDMESMGGLMQTVLPTDQIKQVTSLERATKYQAAATVQGGNRGNLLIAQRIETQAFESLRRMQVYNILQYQEAVEIISPEGELVEINPQDLREGQIQTVIGAGLRGLDKLILVETLSEMLQYVVQNKEAAQTVDVVAVMNYITSLIGDYTNFAQFAHDNEFDKLEPEQKQIAFQLLQKAMQQQQAAQQPNAGQPA